jgi:hypothetical protein
MASSIVALFAGNMMESKNWASYSCQITNKASMVAVVIVLAFIAVAGSKYPATELLK